MSRGTSSGRIEARFAALRDEGRAAFVPFIMAADPDYPTSLELLKGLPEAGADLIEIGVMYSDPMADGPGIQAAGLRSKAGERGSPKPSTWSASFAKPMTRPRSS